MLKSWFTATFLTALGLSTYQYVAADQWDGRADEIVDSFSTEDLIGQMAQIDISVLMTDDLELDEDTVRKYAKMRVGSYLNSPLTSGPKNGTYLWTAEKWREVVTRIQEITMEENGGHPMIYGVDSQINDAASFRPDLVYEQGRITARDTLAAGIPWIFGPILDISRNPLWPRTFETFGEDPYLDSVMADAIVRGLQSNGSTAACMKHWIVYTKTPTGHDKDAVTVSDYDLLNYFLPPFKAAVGAGVLSAMENYISVNGVPLVSNTKLMNALLRDDLGWDGMMVTDYAEIDQLADFHRVARTYDEATRISLTRVSVDMSMIATDDSFMNGTKALLEQSPQYLARVKASARRVVKLKLQLGLYDNPVPGEANVDLIGSENDTATALELARESIVLLKNNDSVLPLAEDASVFLTGHAADDIGLQCGGWTIEWQGYAGHNELYPLGSTMKENIESITGNSSSVSYFNGLNYTGEYSDADLATATEYASRAEFTVAAIGEGPYAEKPGDINDLALPAGQIEYVKQLASTGTKVIVVLFEGRPRLLGDLTDSVYAVIDGLLACEMGGQAVAEILYGKDPANVEMVYNHPVTTLCEDSTETPYYCENEWDFGTGLSYTDFTYSAVTLSKDTIQDPNDSIAVSVDVTNSGSMAGKETVMLFLIQPYRSLNVPEMKQLKKFSKISLEVGETQTVQFTLTAEDWSVYYPQIGRGLKLVAEDSEFWVAIKPETDCDVYNETAIRSSLCSNFTLSTGEYPFGTIEIPW
ncbi:Beta-glucosidase [Phytophthora cactorum]|uniref:beta-glucosidase n=2 Tax=Phytophthora cactorum TaxID=29920 RepID=A0A8T1AR25_9STRA|nr:Beta-glucosidase [Phytophthora cactorum]KAG2877461.1 Beta-glucosidase [Phytophthora cactorum]KAG2885173.1 Beta-glucosidase [Phytophthora cactorum]KAG3056163.1 Beta-glucosidase [Phytophthora cactorum]KAG3208355.1 Beta-glucosidase [Phytophthora cactorum]